MWNAVGLGDFLTGHGPERPAILADLDGCLISGTNVLPSVPELFERCGDRLWIVSNNSTDTSETLSLRLDGLGLSVAPERILLAGETTLRCVADEGRIDRIALYASQALRDLAARLGLTEDRVTPDLAIIARDPSFTFSDLSRLTHLAARGVPVIATNPDLSHPDTEGYPVPETGALIAALRAALPDVVIRAIGKPEPDLARMALERAGVSPSEAIFLGDTPETDGIAARRSGIEFVLLRRPGVAGKAERVPA